MSAQRTDWVAWHAAYGDPSSSLSRRLRVVQDQVRAALPADPLQGMRLELEVVRGDAADPRLYADMVPVDLVLLCGVLGNISGEDVRFVVQALPQLCKTGATVVWTRSRRPPDLTPAIRRWFAHAGFAELAFVAPAEELFSVGAYRFHDVPQPLRSQRLFTFIR